jgi:4-hydroxybenzoate polyprenyltransferase
MYVASCAALGRICLLLSPAPAVVLIVYSLLKRFTNLCHFGIGLCLGMAPLAAFVAASGTIHFSTEVLLLGLFTFCWISGFDMIYSLQDLACDRETGVHSMAVSLGPRGAQVVAAGVHVVAVGCIAWLWRLVGGGGASGAALVVAVAAFAAAYIQRIPVGTRFFPIGAVASIAGAMVVPLGGLP